MGSTSPGTFAIVNPFKAEYLALRRHLQLRPYISDDLFSLLLKLVRRVFS